MRQLIKLLLKKKGLTLAELSKLSGVTYSQIHNYVNGKSDMISSNIQKIADVIPLLNENTYIVKVGDRYHTTNGTTNNINRAREFRDKELADSTAKKNNGKVLTLERYYCSN